MEKLPIHTGETQIPPKESESTTRRERPDTPTFLRRLFLVFCFLGCYYYVIRILPTTEWRSSPCSHGQHDTELAMEDTEETYTQIYENGAQFNMNAFDEQTKVPLEAHIMSKCPDAQACLHKLVLPAMEKISDKVDFQLSFIATVSKESSDIECMHGPTECIGNMLMLCAANLPFPPTENESLLPSTYPRTPIIRSLGFANCLIDDYPLIPDRDLVIHCALEHGIDFDALNRCASQQSDDPDGGSSGSYPPLSGIALLRENALRGEELGVHTSCTVRVDDAVWCVHDGGWKNCVQDGEGSKPQVLIDEINRLWDERN
ncbi:hypothetical protein N7478_004548 [Penicillium angulare]|uniref:uncharacterized protein n=1 Tax=Penicillium angulare TaxID=116970 RepID=UPI0025401A18|nr:uncharacterized protein N7478_004548 [Penicillium angulare]KAJ5279176.1 hypothetical protein N7478_004548 [Penicillium angulare]